MKMMVRRRQFLHLAAGATTLPVTSRFADAENYPTRPVHLVVGFFAGGLTDILARILAEWLSKRFRQQFIVDNQPGAGTNIATERVVRTSPDGYTLLMATSSNAINATLYVHLNFDFLRDTTPVASVARTPLVMTVNPSFPAQTVPEFITYAKAHPGEINIATSGKGSSVRAGKLHSIAVTSNARSQALPDVPAVGEFVPGYEAIVWNGVVAPKNTSAMIIDQLNSAITASLADPWVQAQFANVGSIPKSMTPGEFGKFVAEDTAKWGKVIRAANITME